MLHGKNKPFVREQGPSLGHALAELLPKEARSLSLASLTFALRCSGTLKMTLSQPGQADPATVRQHT